MVDSNVKVAFRHVSYGGFRANACLVWSLSPFRMMTLVLVSTSIVLHKLNLALRVAGCEDKDD